MCLSLRTNLLHSKSVDILFVNLAPLVVYLLLLRLCDAWLCVLCRVKTSGVGVSMVRQPVLKYDSICAVGSSSNHFDDGVYRYNSLFPRHRQPHLFPNARTCANTLAAVIHRERKNHMCATNTNIAKDTTKAWHKDANLVNYNSKWQALDESAAK